MGIGFGWNGCLLLLGSAISCLQAGNQDVTTGMYAATLGAGGATAAERDAFGQNPAAFLPSKIGRVRAGFHLDFHQPYGMEELRVADAGAFCDLSRGGLAMDWRQTEVDGLYQEQGWSIHPAFGLRYVWAGYPIKVDVGGSWTWWNTHLAQEKASSETSHGMGFVWHVLPRLKVGAFTNGSVLSWNTFRYSENIWQWGLEANSRNPNDDKGKGLSQSLHLDFRKVEGRPWRSLAGFTLSPHPVLCISAGFATPPFQVSAGLKLSWEGLQWYQSLRYHRYLGRTFLSGVAFTHELANGGQ